MIAVGGAISRLTNPLTEAVVGAPQYVWNALPDGFRADVRRIAGQPEVLLPESMYRGLDPATASALRNANVVPAPHWERLPPELQAQMLQEAKGVVHSLQTSRQLDAKMNQAVRQAPLGIGSAIEWTFAGRNGRESLVTKVAKGIDRLWQSPPMQMAQGTAKVIGFVAHKGVTALMVLEAAAGGPKIHFYNPTSRQPISEPVLEALTIGYIPKTDGTTSVTLQGSLAPSASITFWATGPVVRNGIPRLDGKNDKGAAVNRIISTGQATLAMVGVVTKVGEPNDHWVRGMTLRPLGELGINPLVGMSTLRKGAAGNSAPKGGGDLDMYGYAVIDPMGFIGYIDSLRIGPVAVTPLRGVANVGPGVRGSVGTSGLGAVRTPSFGSLVASAFQPNPAFNWSPRNVPPHHAEAAPDGKRLIATWKTSEGSSVGVFVRTRGAFQIEDALYVDPATGWMAVRTADAATPVLWLSNRVANAVKVAGDGRAGRFDGAAFQAHAMSATSDQWVQALQTETGRSHVASEILRLGGGHVGKGLDRMSSSVSDATVRQIIHANRNFFLSLAGNSEAPAQ